MKRGAKLFKRKKKKKDKKGGDEGDSSGVEDTGSSYGDYTEDDATSNAGDFDATDDETSDTEEPTAWNAQLVDSDQESDATASEGGERRGGASAREPSPRGSAKASSPRRRPADEGGDDEDDEANKKPSLPATDPLGILGTLSLPPITNQASHVDPSRDGFDARKYLGDLHAQTSYNDLKQGALALRSVLRGQEMQLKTFVRDNFGRFISCKDSIDGIYEEIKDNDMSHHAVQKIRDTYIELQGRSERLFGSLLARRSEIEEKRNVLTALKRYQTIFNLPLAIQNHLEKREYEKAVREYKKAVDYLAGTNVRIFVKVSDQVNALGDVLRERMLASLHDSSLSLAEHEYHMGLLHDLGGDVDPAWHYLSHVQASLVASLVAAPVPAGEASVSSMSIAVPRIPPLAPEAPKRHATARLPAIRRMCGVLLMGLPSLIHMATAHPPAPPQGEEGTRKLVEECLAVYARKVRDTFAALPAFTTGLGLDAASRGKARSDAIKTGMAATDDELEDVRQCILEVAACERSLGPVLATIHVGTEAVAPLVSELSLLFTLSIRRHTLARAAKLFRDEADDGDRAGLRPDPELTDEIEVDGKGWGANVYMAKRLATILQSALRHYQSLPAIEERVVEEIESLALEAVEVFADGLHAVAWPHGNEEEQLADSSAADVTAHDSPDNAPDNEWLVLAMANSAYAREEVVTLIERLIATLRPTAALPKPSSTLVAVTEHLSTLENLLAAEYVRCKAAHIYAALGAALADQLAAPFATSPEVREYTLDLVTGVVTAQAELAPVSLEVRTAIITSLLERITSCYEESVRARLPPPSRQHPWEWGCVPQLHADILFLQAAFAQRLSSTGSAALIRLQKSFLPRLTSSEEAEVRAAVGKGMAHTALILRALQ